MIEAVPKSVSWHHCGKSMFIKKKHRSIRKNISLCTFLFLEKNCETATSTKIFGQNFSSLLEENPSQKYFYQSISSAPIYILLKCPPQDHKHPVHFYFLKKLLVKNFHHCYKRTQKMLIKILSVS